MHDVAPVTTIGQLFYARAPVMNFARLVADLDLGLAGFPAQCRQLSWDQEDVAFLDIDGARIGLSHERDLGPSKLAVVTVTVGHGDGPRQATGLVRRQARVAHLILDRIAARFAPDATLWQQSDEVSSPALLDQLHEAAALHKLTDKVVQMRQASHALPEPKDMPRFIDRIDATLTARRAGQPDPVSVANDVPDVPPPAISELASIRAALYAGPEDIYEPPSDALRLAAFTMDATVMVVALPLGAAMMTYSIGRGANLTASARMLALAGIGVGALQSFGGFQGLMSSFI